MSNGRAMLNLADAGHYARKMHGKVKLFSFGLDTLALCKEDTRISVSFWFGLDTWATIGLSFKFG